MSQPTINAYDCPLCGEATWTVDIDEGVTPFMLGCRATKGCSGMARSRFYQVPVEHPKPTFEWYRLTDKKARKLGQESFDHHSRGGLFLRAARATEPVEGSETE